MTVEVMVEDDVNANIIYQESKPILYKINVLEYLTFRCQNPLEDRFNDFLISNTTICYTDNIAKKELNIDDNKYKIVTIIVSRSKSGNRFIVRALTKTENIKKYNYVAEKYDKMQKLSQCLVSNIYLEYKNIKDIAYFKKYEKYIEEINKPKKLHTQMFLFMWNIFKKKNKWW